MNDYFLENILKQINNDTKYKPTNKPSFLDENGAGKTQEDELVKKLISTCEEGIDYTKM